MNIDEMKSIAWSHAFPQKGIDETMFRKDACGAWIRWDKYGNQANEMGWEIDHIFPVSMGGTDVPDNLRALQHQNNASKGNDYPVYEACMSAEGQHNVEYQQYLRVNEKTRENLRQYYPNA
jgi:hypothetical protein